MDNLQGQIALITSILTLILAFLSIFEKWGKIPPFVRQFLAKPAIAWVVLAVAVISFNLYIFLLPTETSPTMILIDPSTGKQIFPDVGEYSLEPNERVRVKIEPTASEKKFRWWLVPEEFGEFEEQNPTGPEVTFMVNSVPPENESRGTVFACEPDPVDCRAGSYHNIIILTTLTPEE